MENRLTNGQAGYVGHSTGSEPNLVYTPIINQADNLGPISVFYLPIRYLEESAVSGYLPITFYRPDRGLSGRGRFIGLIYR